MFKVKGLECDNITGEYFSYIVGVYETREQAKKLAIDMADELS